MLASFCQIALKNLEIRQYYCGFFVQFATKSDCAILALDLISVSLKIYNQNIGNILNFSIKFVIMQTEGYLQIISRRCVYTEVIIMAEMNETEMKERIMQLEYEAADRSSEILRLKKENERLYQSVKQSVEQASSFRTELEENKRFYQKRIEELAKEKAEISSKLDVMKTEYDRINGVYTSATQAREAVRRDSFELMDRVRETSMDAVTMIDYIRKDIKKLKLDLDNMSRAESTSQSDVIEEIQLMLDLLNTHHEKLKTIKSGFYNINKIKEYDNSVDDLSLTREQAKLVDGNYVD